MLITKNAQKSRDAGALNTAGREEVRAGASEVWAAMGFDAHLSLLRMGFCGPLASAKQEPTACSSLSSQLLLRPTEPAI